MARNFSPKEVAWIVSLPKYSYRIGGTIKQGYYDKETCRIFMVDENGELTGETAVPKAPTTSAPAGEDAPGYEDQDAGRESDREDDDRPARDGARSKKDKKKKTGKPSPPSRKSRSRAQDRYDEEGYDDGDRKKKGSNTFTIVCGIVAALVVILVVGLYFKTGGPASLSAPKVTPTPVPVATETPAPTPSPTPTPPGMVEVSVVQAVGDILKGQQIQADFVENVSITMQEYNQLVAMGATPCKWDELSTVEGMYASSFIAAGSYLSNLYLTVNNPIPANPWRDYTSGYQTITVNMDAVQGTEEPFFGALTIMKAVKNVDLYAEGAEQAPDLYWDESWEDPNPYEHTTYEETYISDTVVQRTFTFTDALVCDLLDANGNSLFGAYIPYIDMPTVNRVSALNSIAADPAKLAGMTPSSVVIRLTVEEATALGSLTNAAVTIAVNGNADASSDTKYSVSWGSQSIIQTLFPAVAAEPVTEVPADPAQVPVDPAQPAQDVPAA